MDKHYYICEKIISISAASFPLADSNNAMFECSKGKTDIQVNCIRCTVLPAHKGAVCFDDGTLRVCSDGTYTYKYNYISENSGAVTVFNSKQPDVCNCYITDDAWNTVLDERYFWNTISLPRILLSSNCLLLHASYIEYRGRGILFAAPSGTGKSTQAALWERHRGAKVVNGDKAGLSIGSEVRAHGVPVCGTSGICHKISTPLRAIVALRQAEENSVQKLGVVQAFEAVKNNCYLNFCDSEETSRFIGVASELLDRVPVFSLNCTPDERAVEALEKMLDKEDALNGI